MIYNIKFNKNKIFDLNKKLMHEHYLQIYKKDFNETESFLNIHQS